jgi:hypothetical protein
MNKEKVLNVIHEQVDSTTALRNVAGMIGDVPVVNEGSVFYPYFEFTARCSVPTIVGKKAMTVVCLVDGINGLAATAESFSTEEIVAVDEMQLQPKVTNGNARQTAQRTVTHRLGKELKMIAPFDVQLEATGVVYKRFWIIRIGDSRIMADSVTGDMHPLSANAA